MDWRLIAAVSAAGGSFCLVAIGAYVVLTHNPTQQRASAAAPMLLAEYRFPVTATSSLISVEPPSPSPFALASNSPFTPQVTASGAAVAPGPVGAYASINPPTATEDFKKSSNRRSDAKQEPRG